MVGSVLKVMDRNPFRRKTIGVYVPGSMRSENASMFGLLQAILGNQYHNAMIIILLMGDALPDFVM